MSEPILSTYLHQRAAQLGQPCSGTFELTPRCNFNCKMCYVHLSAEEQRRRGTELTAAEWLKIGEDACRAGMVFLLLTGGEPLLRPDFMEIYAGLKRMGLLISINSNGFLLRGELLERLLADPPHRFNITLYGVSNETYEALCGVRAYDAVLESIRRLRAADVDVKLNLTMTPENRQEREFITAKAQELGAHLQAATYLFPPVRVTGSCAFPERMSAAEAGRMEAERLENSWPPEKIEALLRTYRTDEGADEDYRRCRAGRSSFWLSWDGKLMPCGMLPHPAADVRSMGFSEAWQQLRAQTGAVLLPEKCRRCSRRELCHICPAKCYAETLGFTEAPAYCCEMTDAILTTLRQRHTMIDS